MATRLEREELLLHPARQRLYETVCQRPGVPFLECLRVLRTDPELAQGSGHGMLMHHLRLLEKFHFIVSRKEGRFRRYFQNGGKFGRATDHIALLLAPPMPLIARTLLENPGITQKALARRVAEAFACTRQTVAYHLRRLEAKGLVLRVEEGNHARYFPLETLSVAWRFTGESRKTQVAPMVGGGFVAPPEMGDPVA